MKNKNLTYSLFLAGMVCLSCQPQKQTESQLSTSLNAVSDINGIDATKLINAYQGMEVRWFFTNEQEAIKDWFAAIAPENVKNEKGRVDFYLNTGYNSMSFKIREGKTEIKVLDKEFGGQEWAGKYKGIVQLWYKWGPELKSNDNRLSTIFSDTTQFSRMVKDRLLIKYSISDNGQIELVKASTRVANGCQVEYTKIQLGSNTFTHSLLKHSVMRLN
jgi:hypothetical protein